MSGLTGEEQTHILAQTVSGRDGADATTETQNIFMQFPLHPFFNVPALAQNDRTSKRNIGP